MLTIARSVVSLKLEQSYRFSLKRGFRLALYLAGAARALVACLAPRLAVTRLPIGAIQAVRRPRAGLPREWHGGGLAGDRQINLQFIQARICNGR